MNLPFMTKFPKDTGTLAGKETFFIEKIHKSLEEQLPYYGKTQSTESYELDFYKNMHAFKFKKNEFIRVEQLTITKPKHHTIRRDSKDRWKVGNDIHFYINARTKDQFQFAPVVKVKGIQKFEIKEYAMVDSNYANKVQDKILVVLVDDKKLPVSEVERLAVNDGFGSISEFFQYFNTEFKGKIIHWTDLKY
jgi:hypothetical protein